MADKHLTVILLFYYKYLNHCGVWGWWGGVGCIVMAEEENDTLNLSPHIDKALHIPSIPQVEKQNT